MAGLLDLFGGNSDSSSGQPGGLMGLMSDPNKAAALGLFQGMMQASGPSRIPVSLGQVFSGSMQGADQGLGNALQMQRGLMQMRMMQGLMGDNPGAPQQGAPASASQPMPAVSGAANTGPMSGLSAGLGGSGPMPAAASGAASGAYPATQSNGGPLIMGMTPAQAMQKGQAWNFISPGSGTPLITAALAYSTPTDNQKNISAAYGYNTPQAQQALQAIINKEGTVTGRAGGYLQGPNGTQWLPNVPQGGMPVMQNGAPTGAVTAQPGAADVIAANAAAKTGGEGSMLPYAGNDAAGNPLPVTNRTAAATQGAGLPLPLRNNNPGAVSPGGSVANYPDLNTGLQAMDQNLASYAGQQGTGTLGGVITKWVGSPPNAPAYIKDVTARLGVGANQPVDLTNPAQRQAIATAIMLHENGPSAVFSGGRQTAAPSAPGGAIYAAPPMGATTAANASQGAPSKQMADAYGSLSNADANYQQSREALNNMLALAGNKGTAGAVVGVLPESVGTKISPDAAEYQKLHATYVALQGKAMGSGGTDAARATIDEAVPTYDKPQTAMVSGLNTQLANLDLNHIKTQFLTPVYQQGNEKAYTQQSAAFDNNVTPQMVPMLTMPAGPQRAQALQQALKANPALKPKLDWAVQNGILQ